jgi:sarcosine oxidase subunit beta
MRTAEVAIVGGGIHGCSAALHLALRGVKTMVVEKDHIGRHASGVNSGGVRTLGRDFAEVPLALASRDLWHDIAALVDDDCGFQISGQIKIAETEAELDTLAERVRALEAMGFRHERLIGANELRAWIPSVAEHCIGGILAEQDGFAEPFRATAAFGRRAQALGADILQGVVCAGIRRQGGGWRLTLSNGDAVSAGTLVNCAGAWGSRVAAMAGDSIPLVADGSMQIVTSRLPRFVTPVIGATGRSLSLKQVANGTVVIGGGRRSSVNLETGVSTVTPQRLAAAARDAAALFPILGSASLVRFWSGIEGFTPDRIPVLGISPESGVTHAFGFSAHGFQLGPICGRIVADLVTSGRSDLPIAPFAVDRFGNPAKNSGARVPA